MPALPAAPPPEAAHPPAGDPPPGLLVLHGNRLEDLHHLVLYCQQRWPLPALEPDVVLVQSNGAGEWFKAAQARAQGISAATRVELPSRFVWQVYRRVLEAGELSARSPLDRHALVWRLLRLLPDCRGLAGLEPVAAFLRDDDPLRLLQLAQRLADLYDQYQVYRADWLEAWERGEQVLFDAGGRRQALAAGQAWQARLWRELLDGLDAQSRPLVRPRVHQRALERLRGAAVGSLDLPPRVCLFGAATVAPAVLDLLVALARHAQVIVAVPNPCRFHWADIVEGRELLRPSPRRHGLRGGVDPAGVALPAMHAHAHPLLAAWGRQGRDFMRQLDACEVDGPAGGELPRTDVFDEQAPRSLLEHVQAAIRDLLPLAEHAAAPFSDDDDSIQFHVTHGVQREVEVLHDRLLDLLARDGGERGRLRPRDVVVMVPDIEVFAPAVRAVFGQYAADDSRHIPFDIADLRQRSGSPMLLALEWLLGITRRRVTLSEIRDLLEVPAIAERLGLEPSDHALLARWMAEAGARWGLHASQRASLGLAACGELNSWHFGLRRMLLGYASGDAAAWRGTEPLREVGGLDAALVGVLHGLLEVLEDWWRQCREPATPAQWAQRARELLERCMRPADESERQVLTAMHEGLAQWLHDCECAGFEQDVAVEVFAQAWLERIDDTRATGRFLAGGVTFCSLLPLRAIPFEVVCLLGMNDDAYPRGGQRSDFDLMALPGQYRPGDRSRRDDDRYLMLEALLSARRVLYLSWCGRSARDNTERAPSVLVSQLRDYLAAGFAAAHPRPGESPGQALLRARTTEHALQPFSRRYFEPGGLRTWAREWFALHGAPPRATAASAPPSHAGHVAATATLRDLAAMLRNPVKLYFRARLDVVFDTLEQQADDDEVFALRGLPRHALVQELLELAQPGTADDAEAWLQAQLHRAAASGRLPLAGPGERFAQELGDELEAVLRTWNLLLARHGEPVPRQALRLCAADEAGREGQGAGPCLEDWLQGLRRTPADGIATWLELGASRLREGRTARPRLDRLLLSWVRMLASAACGVECQGYVVGVDAVVHWRALPAQPARVQLLRLLHAWERARREPLPWGVRSALAQARQRDARIAYEGTPPHGRGDVDDPYLARLHPDFDSLRASGEFETFARELFEPLCAWAQDCVQLLDLAARHALPSGLDGGADD